jgi:glycosyltransferase involved in cell wall biosynthesis
MKVLIDLTDFGTSNYSLDVYGDRLVSSLKPEEGINYTLLIHPAMEQRVKASFPGYAYILFERPEFNGLMRSFCRYPKLYQGVLKLRKITADFDVFLTIATHYHNCFRMGCPKVSVLHDLTYTHTPKTLRWWHNYKSGQLMMKGYVKTADRVIAISNYTRDHIFMEFPFAEKKKVTVVYNSVPMGEEALMPARMEGVDDFILDVNTLKEYKNLMTLLKAFARLGDRYAGKLVVVGTTSPYWAEVLLPFIKEHHLEDRVIQLSNLRDEELTWLYKHARVLVSPSLHEGFGYTPIEAAMRQCPVICSMCEALPDTTQMRLAYYDPPKDDAALANELTKILNNPPSRDALQRTAVMFKELYAADKQVESIVGIVKNIVS